MSLWSIRTQPLPPSGLSSSEPSVSYETPAKVFSSTNVPFRKNHPINLKFQPSGLLERNSQIFFWPELETSSHFSPKLSMAFQCHNIKLVPQFFAQPMYFLEKTTTSNLKLQPSSSLEPNWQIWFAGAKFTDFFLVWIGNLYSLFPKTSHGLSVSQDEPPATVFGWTDVLFTKANPIKVEILTLWLAATKFTDFFLGSIGNQ